MLSCHQGRGFPDVENDVQFGKVYIRIDGDDGELEKLRDTLKANRAKIRGDIETKPWGLRDLTVEDPDGVSPISRLQRNESREWCGCCLADPCLRMSSFSTRGSRFCRSLQTLMLRPLPMDRIDLDSINYPCAIADVVGPCRIGR